MAQLAACASGFGGFALALSFTAIGQELAHPMVRALCVVSVVVGPTFVIVARAGGYEFKTSMFVSVMVFALVGPFGTQQLMHGFQEPFQVLYLVGPISAAYYLTLRQAAAFILIDAVLVIAMSQKTLEPNGIMRALILAHVVVGGSLMLHFIKRQLVSAVRSNQVLSERDPLTGTHNLRRFESQLSDELARTERDGEPFGLIEFDLDVFKQVNDSYSHTAGDDVLIATVDAIQSVLEPHDLLVRRGGDEFAVIVPASRHRDIDGLIRLARERIEHVRHEHCPNLAPSVSVGWVAHRQNETAAELFIRADEALHAAKKSAPGRRDSSNAARPSRPENRPTPAAESVLELRRQRAESTSFAGDLVQAANRIAWRTAALATLFLSVVAPISSLTGAAGIDLSPELIALSLVCVTLMTPAILLLSRRAVQPAYMVHLLVVMALVLISAVCLAVGQAAPAMAEMYLMAIFVLMSLLPPRYALAYSLMTIGLYATVLFASGDPNATIRLVNTGAVIAMLGAVVSFTRSTTIRVAASKAELARTDALTGLPNTRRLADRLAGEIRRCEHTGESLALVMLDLDEFKTVNDHLSHAVGDRVLIAVADAISASVRHADMPARRGGDEFAVVLTDAAEEDAVATCDRIAEQILSTRATICPQVTPTASIGWAVWLAGESVEQLIARADSALHDVKADRHRVRALVA